MTTTVDLAVTPAIAEAKPPKKLDLRKKVDYEIAAKLVANMVAAIPFRDRHLWLTTHGWKFAYQGDPHHQPDCQLETSPYPEADGLPIACTCNARPRKFYSHASVTGFNVCNQTAAMYKSAWDILRKKEIIR